MKRYIGTKIVAAKTMTRLEYNQYRCWELPENENGSDQGFLIEHLEGGESEHDNHVSWLPKELFDKTYQGTDQNMSFGHAIEMAKDGCKIARKGWNGKNMFVVYMPPLQLPPHSTNEPGPKVNDRTAKHIGKDTPLNSQAYFAMFNAQKEWIPGWLASQSDMLANDWVVVD